MQTVTVKTSGTYSVHIGSGLLAHSVELISSVTSAKSCAVITDSTVGPLYAKKLCDALESSGIRTHLYTFLAGEQNKTLSTYGQILAFLAQKKLTRSDFIVALGGGVTGDMAGFAAATYQRGIDYIQIPTTFLAASDSSVGGKTAVDLPSGKNLVGAFWQPRLVICDTDTFRTLPEKVFADGIAETAKHGLIADADFFRFLLTEDIHSNIDWIVRRNVEIKAAVVGADEFEKGQRKLLNFGHTLGHAIETLSNFSITHGHAVAIGMVLAARAAEKLELSAKGSLDTVLSCLRRFDLPTECSYSAQDIYSAAIGDKKRSGGYIDVVVLEEIGKARTVRLDMEGLRQFVEAAL